MESGTMLKEDEGHEILGKYIALVKRDDAYGAGNLKVC